jgi:cell division transport system permease protein
MITLWRIMQSGLRNFLRNAWLSAAATAVMTVTLSIVLFSFASNSALTATIRAIVNKIDVSVYLSDSLTPDQAKQLQQRVERLPNVKAVKYISKAEALVIFRQEHAGDKKILQGVDESDNFLPASLQIKAQDPKKLGDIVSFFNQPDIKPMLSTSSAISYAGDRKTAIDRIVRASNFLKTFGLVASGLFITISILIIFNTIRMAIYTRRSEIEIMKLVGATNWFIRGPFIVEASLYGVIAAVIAIVLCYSLLPLAPNLASYVPDIQSTIDVFRNYPVLIAVVELGLGIFIGAFSSLLAMVRYLKL